MPKFLIIEARFYDNLADMLAASAIAELEKANIKYDRISVPGSFEIPATLSMAISSGAYDGYVTLGCVIRGETSHYDHVCEEASRGINHLAVKHQVPVGFGIITAENKDQAMARADANKKDMGGKAAKAAIRMLEIKQKLENIA